MPSHLNQPTAPLDAGALVMTVVGLAALFALFAVVRWWTRRTYAGFNLWASAGGLLVPALSLLVLRGRVPDWAGVVCADSLIVMASILYLEGAWLLTGTRPRKWFAYAGGAFTILAVVFFDYVVPSLNARAVVMSAFMAIVFTFTSIRLLGAIPPQHKFGMAFTGSMFAATAVLLAARAVYFGLAPSLSDSQAFSGVSAFLSVTVMIGIVCIGLGIVLLADERVLSDMYAAREKALRATVEIDEHLKTEALLRAREERFRTMANTAPVMIWIAGADKLCTFFNKGWLDFTGRSLEQELGNGWAEGVHPEDLDRCVAIYHSSFDTRHDFTMEYRLRRRDGEYRWVLDSGTPLYDRGTFSGYIGSAIDVSEQKRIEERLRTSEARLLKAQRLARVGNWELDLKAGTIYWSDEMLRTLGFPRNGPVDFEAFLNTVYPGDRARIQAVDEKVRASEVPIEVEYRIVRPDGQVRFVRSIVEATRDDQGTPAGIVGASQDITDSRRAQDEAFARQKFETLGTLAAGIAHDFNNLLGAVLAQAESAAEALAAGTHPNEELKLIQLSAIRGSEIVRQLMAYCGEENEALELVDISRVVEEMADLLRISLSRHAVLETDLHKDLGFVSANTGQIRRILMNLMTNASEAIGDRSGVVSVRTSCVTLSQETSGANAEHGLRSDYVQLEISDTGCGMPLEMQAKVFDPFFTTRSSGRGLGLAVVRGLVQSLQGTIRLESEPGKGTKFQVLLPCASSAAEGMNRGTDLTREQPGQSHGTVLIVEDEDELRRPVSKMLRARGFTVIQIGDGDSALEAIRSPENHIDILLLDITLPGASSREVFEQATRLRPEMKVIVTSAYSREMAAESLSGKVQHFIRKPYRLSDLMDLTAEARPV
jgi:PAS domain S-box-containing protein